MLTRALVVSSMLCTATFSGAQASRPDVLLPGDNLVLEHIPAIPSAAAEATARYGESRPAQVFSWHPTRREMLIGTRFGETVQVHSVAMPGGARRQMTFFPDRVSGAQYLPDGNSFLFLAQAQLFDVPRDRRRQIVRCHRRQVEADKPDELALSIAERIQAAAVLAEGRSLPGLCDEREWIKQALHAEHGQGHILSARSRARRRLDGLAHAPEWPRSGFF